eukprot:gene3148-609_t
MSWVTNSAEQRNNQINRNAKQERRKRLAKEMENVREGDKCALISGPLLDSLQCCLVYDLGLVYEEARRLEFIDSVGQGYGTGG